MSEADSTGQGADAGEQAGPASDAAGNPAGTTGAPANDAARDSDPGRQPSEDELRAAYEAEMGRITSTDMVLQATVSLLNIGGYRLGLTPPPGEAPDARGASGSGTAGQARDLEQVRDAIDAVRALLPILDRRRPGELRPLRDALSQLQMAYAREAGAGSPPADQVPGAQGTQTPPAAGREARPAAPAQTKPGEAPGPAESSGRLWVPGR